MPRLRVQVIESRQRLNNRNILPEMRSKNDDRNQGRQNYHSKDDNRKSIKLSDGQMIKNWVYESKGIYFRGLKIQHSILFLYFDSSQRTKESPTTNEIMGLYAHARLWLTFVKGVETLRERVRTRQIFRAKSLIQFKVCRAFLICFCARRIRDLVLDRRALIFAKFACFGRFSKNRKSRNRQTMQIIKIKKSFSKNIAVCPLPRL